MEAKLQDPENKSQLDERADEMKGRLVDLKTAAEEKEDAYKRALRRWKRQSESGAGRQGPLDQYSSRWVGIRESAWGSIRPASRPAR